MNPEEDLTFYGCGHIPIRFYLEKIREDKEMTFIYYYFEEDIQKARHRNKGCLVVQRIFGWFESSFSEDFFSYNQGFYL